MGWCWCISVLLMTVALVSSQTELGVTTPGAFDPTTNVPDGKTSVADMQSQETTMLPVGVETTVSGLTTETSEVQEGVTTISTVRDQGTTVLGVDRSETVTPNASPATSTVEVTNTSPDVSSVTDKDATTTTASLDSQSDQTTQIPTQSPTERTESELTTTASTSSTTSDEEIKTLPTSEETNEESRDSGRQGKQMRFDDNDMASKPKLCPCPDALPDVAIVSEKDPSTCPVKRVIADPECPCVQVCARQPGQKCGPGAPCDVEFGLKCQTDTKTCLGKLQLQTAEVTHDSVTLRWRSSSKFPEIPQASLHYSQNFASSNTKWIEGEVKESTARVDKLRPHVEYFFKIEENGVFEIMAVRTEDGCLINNGTTNNASVGLGETFNPEGCEQTCTCREGGQSECRERCPFRPGALQDPLCTEVPDMEDPCCVMYKCSDHQPSANAKVIVTQRTPTSLTLAWDDFKLPNYESGYVVEYRALDDTSNEWQQVQAGNIPLMTITKLRPHTAYHVRVMVWEDIDSKKRGASSEVVTIYTEDGCIRNNRTLSVGEEFSEGCDLSCVCKGGDEGECRDRCMPPYYRAGSFAKDPYCTEEALDSDPCCVTVRCTQGLGPRDSVTSAEHQGTCPEGVQVMMKDNTTCPSTCKHDHDCTEGPYYKCCANTCGGNTCIDVAPHQNVCAYVYCGTNAHCALDGELPKCVCMPGFVGDPNSLEGCQKIFLSSEHSTKQNLCFYGNSSYSRGATFEIGCDLRCSCGDDLEVACTPRCSFHSKSDKKNASFSADPLCELIEDPHDSCCTILACENHADTTKTLPPVTSTPQTTTLIIDFKSPRNGSTQRSLEFEYGTTSMGDTTSPTSTETMSTDIKDVTSEPSTTLSSLADEVKTTDGMIPIDTSSEFPSTTVVAYDTTLREDEPKTNTTETDMQLAPEGTDSEDSTTQIPVTSTTQELSSTSNTALPTSLTDESSNRTDSLNDLETSYTEIPLEELEKENSTTYEGEGVTVRIPNRLDGCEYNNGTYLTGEMFDDGCDSRCSCDGPGRVSCVPRCPLIAGTSDEKFCREVEDPSDRCCKIIVCERPGDKDAVKNVDGLKLKIDSVEPQNSTTVRLRVTVGPIDLDDSPPSPSTNAVQVWYAPSKPGMENDSSAWKKENYKLGDMQRISQNVFEIDVRGLEPETEYFFKVKKYSKSEPGSAQSTTGSPVKNSEKSIYSNTVNVKTFSKAVQTTFKGCFHHNNTYEIGQVFFDGCQYKCVCHEKGLIQCQDRCEQYVDTAGFEHCQWGPAPDDPCCTIPFCNGDVEYRVPPSSSGRRPSTDPHGASCVMDDGLKRPLGDTWELGEGCTRKVCTCAMRSNGTTVVECSGGCSPIPASVQHPTPECPQPVLVTPDDPCLCPYILCNNAVNPLSVPTPMCQYKGNRYHVGEEFHDGCRSICHCGRDLRVNCAAIECPHHFPAHLSECLEWDIDPDFVAQPPKCCPPAKCKNDGSCHFKGMQLSNFQPVPQELLDCGTRCVCVNGNVTCEQRCPKLPASPPPNLNCPPSLAYKGHIPGDPCCLHWICMGHPDRQDESSTNAGRQGLTNGAPTTERGKGLENVSLVALNSTAVRLRFTLPSLLVGLAGHAELRFTSDPSVARDAWHVQKFARPQRLFDTANIEYHLSGLRPGTTYFFQVALVIDALHSGPESEIYKLKLPTVDESSTTTVDLMTSATDYTTVTSTTLPPMILVDAMLSSEVTEPGVVKVTWRPFETEEKRFIDGVRLKYRKVPPGGDRAKQEGLWKATPMIHRDVNSFIIRDLEPSESYQVDMEFVTPDEVTTHLVSTKMIEMKMPPVPKKEDIKITVKSTGVHAFSTDLAVQGIPEPHENFVNVIKVTYKSDADAEPTQVYKNLKTDGKIPLDQLKPGRRYKVWLDFYLTNGKTISSNVIDVMTKAAPPGAKSSEEPTANNMAEALQGRSSDEDESKSYYIALIVVAVIAAVAALGFIILLVILLRRQSSAKAPITRSPSEAAYDNPTYKETVSLELKQQTYDASERHDLEKNGNGNGVQPC